MTAPPPPEDVVRRFAEAINSHDADAVAAFLTDDHVFIDSLGNRLSGRQNLLLGWRKYFQMFPDYSIQISSFAVHQSTVAAFGGASGTYAAAPHPTQGFWTIPAAWRAIVVGDRIAEWQVYADNSPVVQILQSSAQDP
jgi:uncharacterized protein (TIGR02246 family)